MTFVQQARPKFAFGEQEEGGLQGAEIGPHRPAEIERKVEDPFGAEALASQRLAGPRRSGDDDAPAGCLPRDVGLILRAGVRQ